MPTIDDVDDIAKTNPNVDPNEVREAEETLRRLREQRESDRGYDVISPYEHRPIRRQAKDAALRVTP